MSLRVAFIDAAPAMRVRMAKALMTAFPRSEVESFVPPDQLPDQSFDWSAFDAIVVGEFSDDELVLPFVRHLALNPSRRPVVYLHPNGPDTSTSASLKLLAVVKLPREHFRDDELVSAVIFARRDRGYLAPDSGPIVPTKVLAADAPFDADADPLPAPHIQLLDGSPGFRRIIANFFLSVWPAASVEEIDPFAQTMYADGFALSTDRDILVLSGVGTRSEALSTLDRLRSREHCPPIILILSQDLAPHVAELKAAGAAAVLLRDSLSRNALCLAAAQAMGLIETPSPTAANRERSGAFSFLLDGERFSLEVGGFRCVAPVAATAMSQVFQAERLSDGKHAVVKILTATTHHDLKGIEVFCSRFRFFSGLKGRNVVRYLDAGIAGHWPYLALEYLPAGDLRSRMRQQSAPKANAGIAFKLAAALSTIHSGAFVHLDLKPEHILFRENGELALIDFNIATRFGGVARHRINGDVLGTPAYMSPEQGLGLPLDGRSDLYSAGVIFYEMLTGALPYTGKSDAEIIFRHIHDEVPLLPRSLRKFQPIIDGLMAKNRDERFATGADLAFALQPLLGDDDGELPD